MGSVMFLVSMELSWQVQKCVVQGGGEEQIANGDEAKAKELTFALVFIAEPALCCCLVPQKARCRSHGTS